MSDAIEAYRSITADEKFRHIELLREMAEHDEAQRMGNAERRGEKRGEERGKKSEREKWQSVVAEKDAALADKDAALVDKVAVLANKDAENERLRKELAELRAQLDGNK